VVGHHDVCLLKQFDALSAPEVPVAPEGLDPDLFGIGNVVAVLVPLVLEVDGLLRVVLANEICVLALVASGDELPESQLLEVVGEVMEEVAHAGVVAVAIDDLALEVLFVVPQFLLDIRQLRLELVLLGQVGVGEGAFKTLRVIGPPGRPPAP
jgi:hypothetical protein